MTPAEVDRIMQQVADSHLDHHARVLTKRWVEAWRDVATELDAALVGMVTPDRAGQAPISPARLTSSLRLIEDELASLSAQAAATISDSTPAIVGLGAQGSAEMIAAQLPRGATFNRADQRQLDAITERTTGRIIVLTAGITDPVLEDVKRRLVRGIAVGDNPRTVADQILADTRGAFDGGLTRALVISRTEMLDAMRAAAQSTERSNPDLLRGWQWVAHLDSRTCPACVGMHGTEWPTEEPGPYGHQQCRCARVPLAKSWAELGFPGIPDTTPPVPDAAEWFDGLSAEEQTGILGPARQKAWAAGEYPMSSWAVRQSNSGWRDSYVTSPIPGGTE